MGNSDCQVPSPLADCGGRGARNLLSLSISRFSHLPLSPASLSPLNPNLNVINSSLRGVGRMGSSELAQQPLLSQLGINNTLKALTRAICQAKLFRIILVVPFSRGSGRRPATTNPHSSSK